MFFQMSCLTYFDTTHQHVRGNNKNLRTIKLLAVIMKFFQHPQIHFGKASKKIVSKMSESFANQAANPMELTVSQCHPLQPFRKARHSRNTRP